MYSFNEPTLVPVFRLFGMPVYPYALCIALGAAVALVMALLRARRTGLPAAAVLNFALLGIPLAACCGRVAFCLCRFVDVLDFGVGYIFRLDYGGFSLMGVVVGLLIAAFLTRLISRVPLAQLLDTVVPGLLIALAFGRFGEGSTMNGTGPEVTVAALQLFPLARTGLYGDATFAINMAEGLTAFIAGVYTQAMAAKPRGRTAGTGVLIACAGQILWESTRRDEVLTISFVRYVMVFSALVLLVILLLSLHRLDWPFGGKALVIAGFFLGVAVCGVMEFFIDGKIWQNVPIWLCYLCDTLAVCGMAYLCLRTLRAACEDVYQ